jgi:uncharacterized protein
MIKDLALVTDPKTASFEEMLKKEVAKKIDLNASEIRYIRINKKSIDARSKDIKVNLTVQVFIGEMPDNTPYPFNFQNVSGKKTVAVIGTGPAGLFAALKLIELGIKPVIFERGADVSTRKKDIARLNREHLVYTESNYCYGEGGAGTFSDGKLYTRSNKRGDISRILKMFHYHGAEDSVLFESHPHIGTDKLPEIIKNIRDTILNCGGEIYFNSRIDDIIIENSKVTGVKTLNGDIYNAEALVLATGHSARDIYELLNRKGIALEAKPFAMGVRVEHPQVLIDSIQYHRKERGPYLPAASYNLVSQVDDRGVYSFCMCPGGYIVPSATSPDEIVVNGMSASRRHTPFANSGIVVEIRPEDYQKFSQYGVLAGLHYQKHLEQLARNTGGKGQCAPAQRLFDFVKGKVSDNLPQSSYIPGLVSSPLHTWLPEEISSRLRKGFQVFDKKMHGFLTNEAYVAGVESRTSSPVRIPRNPETMEHITVNGLFPCGEGAGYAGGIASSAMDGENAALKISEYLQRK